MTTRPDADEPERYACKPGECCPNAYVNEPGLLDATWLPNDKAWLWKCEHGRPHLLKWEYMMTAAEVRDQIGLKEGEIE